MVERKVTFDLVGTSIAGTSSITLWEGTNGLNIEPAIMSNMSGSTFIKANFSGFETIEVLSGHNLNVI